MAVARDEIAPDRKEAERLLLRGGAAEADRVMDGGDAARPEVRGLLFAQRLGVIFRAEVRSEEHTSELQSLMRISYAVFCLKKKKRHEEHNTKLQSQLYSTHT